MMMESLEQYLEIVPLIGEPPRIEIFIAPEVFQALGYEGFDGSHVTPAAVTIAQMSSLANYNLSSHGVTNEKPFGARIWFIHRNVENHPAKCLLPKYSICLHWKDNRMELTSGYLTSKLEEVSGVQV